MTKHKFYEAFEALHNTASEYKGGACLRGHIGYYEEGNSCSYRWQGLAKAEESPARELYNSHDPECHLGGTGWGGAAVSAIEQGKAGIIVSRHKPYNSRTKTGKEIPKQVVVAKNFTTGYAPYANQVHHVLPTAVLRNSILAVAEPAPQLVDLIAKGLLQEKYNINHMDNMLILPSRDRDARKTGLPTHCGDHPEYSGKVRDHVMNAMRPYQDIAEQVRDGEPHDEPQPADLKENLEDISGELYGNIIEYAKGRRSTKTEPGKINALPESVFNLSM
ncbi:AHH domain-containing protein [Sorangium sp. So ce375]|uniref:AHH domain-containing protein n=1 Tax=Sorangium sp. So ce375 TaxID=3133306 RepID=UPI003F5AE4BE